MTTTSLAIDQKDLIPFSTYKKSRDEYIRKMIAYKNARRVRLDSSISLLFENHQTVFFQIQELVYSEDLTDSEEIKEYIDIYSTMIPDANEFSATLFIEIDDQLLLEKFLAKMKGIEHTLFMKVGDETLQAVFEEVHDDREFTTSVHYVKIPLTENAKSYLKVTAPENAKVSILLDHESLHSEVRLSVDTVSSLLSDLTE